MDRDDMNRLQPKLEITDGDINISFIKNCSNPQKAKFEIFKSWLKRQPSREAAYVTMGEALIHPDVGLNLIATEVLDYPPPKVKEAKRKKYSEYKDTTKMAIC